MNQPKPIRLLSVCAAAAALSLLACGGDLNLSDDGLPAASVTLRAAPDACSGAGSGAFSFELADVQVISGNPGSAPQNRVVVTGSVSGIAVDDTVEIILLLENGSCPILATSAALLDGGNFTAVLDFSDFLNFSAVLVAHAGTAADLDCSVEAACLATAAGSFSAVSATIDVDLR